MKKAMIEELLLEQKFGKRRPFKVPDGYFDRFEGDMNGRLRCLPVMNKHTVKRRVCPFAWVACAVAVVVLGVFCFSGIGSIGIENADTDFGIAVSSPSTDYVIEEMSDYAMLDNDDYYSFIADE